MKFEKLGSIVKISKGKKHALAPRRLHQNSRYIQIEDLRNNENLKYTDEKGVEVHENDLIIAWDGANAGTIGFGLRGMIGSTLARLRIKEDKEYNTDFIGYFLKGQFDYLQANATGATIPHIDRDSLEALKIPVLDYPEQYEIAQILSKSENLIKQRKESIELLDKFLESIFYEMFGDPVRNEKGWETKTIEQLIKKEKYSLKRGPFGGALKKEIFVPSGYLVYEQFHALNNDFTFGRYYIDEEKFKELKAFEVKPGDIIVSCSGVYLGKLAIVPKGAPRGIINQALLKITLDNSLIVNNFFVFVFKDENFKKKFYGNSIGSGIPNFPPMDDFKKFRFIHPPIGVQNKFSSIVTSTETLKLFLNESLRELENLFGSLNQRAFKGELQFKNIPQKEIGDPLEGMDLPEGELPKLDDIIKQSEGKAEVVSGDDEKEKATSPFEDISTVTGSISNYKPVLADVQPFIQKSFRDNYFTFDNLKQATVKAGWQYDFETLKNYVFELLRKGQLRQVFADATFKASFKESDADYKKITGLTEQMYLQQPATSRL